MGIRFIRMFEKVKCISDRVHYSLCDSEAKCCKPTLLFDYDFNMIYMMTMIMHSIHHGHHINHIKS